MHDRATKTPSAAFAMLAIVAASLAVNARAGAQEAGGQAWEGPHWLALPLLNFNEDDGFGFGAIGNMHWHAEDVEPFTLSLNALALVTHRLVQKYGVVLEWVDVGGMPLRLGAMVWYYESRSAAFCGFGNLTRCSHQDAVAAAQRAGLQAGDRGYAGFVHRYHLNRMHEINGQVQLRWRVVEAAGKLELFGGLRLTRYRPGVPGEPGPYPGSLFAEYFPDGQNGYVGLIEAGVTYDTRDYEPWPTRGMWLEASIRGAPPLGGSYWGFGGGNITVCGYLPLTLQRDVLLAARFVADLVGGDLPAEEMFRVGGTQYFSAYGGTFAGRGVRARRFLGRIRLIGQAELRWLPISGQIWGSDLTLWMVMFTDMGWIGVDWDHFGGDPKKIIPTAGYGVRLQLNRDTVVRADVGLSRVEGLDPMFYVELRNAF